MPEYVVAVDLGGTKLAAAAVDDQGMVAHRIQAPVERTDFETSIGQIVSAIYDVSTRAGGDIAGVGLIVPGIYNDATGTAWAPNLWGLDEVPLQDTLRMHVSLPVAVDSDRAGYILGEQWLGAAHGSRDAIFVAVGTGIGAGIISGGRLIRGAGNIAGAVGWYRFGPEGANWESEAAGPAFAQRAGCATAEEAAQRARDGDARAMAAVRVTAESIALGVANLISTFNPEVVILGGGLMQSHDLFLEAVREAVPRSAQPIAARQVRIEASALGGDAGLLGAARIALGFGL
jgi:glucokinase